MIEVLVAAALGLAAGGWLRARRARGAVRAVDVDAPTTGAVDELFAGLACGLSDVVLVDDEEAWLEGALVFREAAGGDGSVGVHERTVAALFFAPVAGKHRAVYARALPPASLHWLDEVFPGDPIVGAEPASALEVEGIRFERTRRLPLRITRVGEGAPDLEGRAVIAEYDGGAGASLVVVAARGASRTWRGRRLEEGMYAVLPGAQGSRAQRMPSSS